MLPTASGRRPRRVRCVASHKKLTSLALQSSGSRGEIVVRSRWFCMAPLATSFGSNRSTYKFAGKQKPRLLSARSQSCSMACQQHTHLQFTCRYTCLGPTRDKLRNKEEDAQHYGRNNDKYVPSPHREQYTLHRSGCSTGWRDPPGSRCGDYPPGQRQATLVACSLAPLLRWWQQDVASEATGDVLLPTANRLSLTHLN